MSEEFNLGDSLTVHFKNRPEIKSGLSELAESYQIYNKVDLLRKMIQVCQEKGSPSPKVPASNGKESFFARVDPMDQELVENMRLDLWKSKKLKNEGILSYFVSIHQNLKEKILFLVKPPKAIRKKLLEITGDLIDHGEVQSEGQYISMVLRDHFKALAKKQEKPAEPIQESKPEKPSPKEEASKGKSKWSW